MASIAIGAGNGLILTRSKPLRLLTLLLFYFAQGFPIGLFFYALPAWMSVNGASTPQVASVVAAASLPWSLKLVNGFLIDRYTYLPMGRRRIWIICAQGVIVTSFLVGALLSPDARAVFLLSALGFASNAAVTFQDVGIDSLAVDIMPEDERAKAAGIMFGAQLLGIAASTSLGGTLFQYFDLPVGLAVLAVIPLAIMLFGMAIRERDGERRLPWTEGEAHPGNLAIQVEAWWPLLKSSFKALVVPITLGIAPILLARSVPHGAFEAFHPELFTQIAGWEISGYTNLISTSSLVSGLLGLVIGGWMVDAIGSRASLLIGAGLGIVLLTFMGLATDLWTQDWWLTTFIILFDILGLLYIVATIPICMRLCLPAVAATQFTIYMAMGNFGRPLGAWMASWTAGAGHPEWLYFCSAIAWACATLLALFVRFPEKGTAVDEVVSDLPGADGIPARID